MKMRRARTFVTPVLIALVACTGCEPKPQAGRRPVTTTRRVTPTQPAEPEPASSEPATQPEEPATKPAEPKKPQRISLKWATFADAFDKDADAVISGDWTGGDRVELKTRNVRRMVVDFRELPGEGKRRGPPWNVQIDGYALEITGRRGPRIELTHRENGGWDVTGPPPRKRP